MDYLGEMETSTSLKAIVSKLQDSDYHRWLGQVYHIKESKRRVTLEDVIQFLERLASERTDPVFGLTDTKTKEKPEQKSPRKKSTAYATNVQQTTETKETPKAYQTKPVSTRICPKCKKGAHFLNQCQEFRSLAVKDRLTFVRSNGLCVNCFQHGHIGMKCTKTWVCNVDGCGKKHNRWLHLPTTPTTTEAAEPKEQEAQQQTTEQQTTQQNVITTTTVVNEGKIALPIKPVKVKSADGKLVTVYALHDNCSNGSLCTERLVEKLGLPTTSARVGVTTVNETSQVKCKMADLELHLPDGSVYTMHQVLARPSLNINRNHLGGNEDLKRWPHLRDLEIPEADVAEVDLLIGQDNPDLLIPLETRQGGSGEPFGVRTCLGWGINGPLGTGQRINRTSHFTDLTLERKVERFWRLDDPLCPDDPAPSVSDRRVVSEWESSVTKDGRHYSLGIPFKYRPPGLPNNYNIVKHRLNLLEKRLGKDADAGKATFVSLMGLDQAKQKAKDLIEESHEAINCYGERASVLRDTANFIISRDK